MPNRFQIKRTTTTGLLPNVSNSSNTSYIAAGELAINLTDRKLLSSNGSATFEIGANLASIVVGTAFTQTSGNANFDSGVLFVDGTNNRVGVNNTTPGHALSVTGTTNLGGAVTGITTLAAGNTTITGFVNATSSVNAASLTVGSTLIANATGMFITSAAPQISLNNATSNWITYSLNGAAAPTTTTRSAGTKLALYPSLSATQVDYAIGIESNHMWFSTDNATTGVKFYANTNNYMTANVAGLTVSGVVAADYYTAANNGNGTNYKVGDDAWLGDINLADTVSLKGQQNSSVGYIRFATAPTSLGYNGTSLIYSSNVSIGNTSVNGFITATGDITAFFSDDRLKDRIGNIPHAIEKVKSLNGFYYEPNITAQDLGYQKEMHVGVSAQEVNAIMPEVVAPAPIDNKYLTVKYERLIPLLIEAIKEQQIQIDELKEQLSKD